MDCSSKVLELEEAKQHSPLTHTRWYRRTVFFFVFREQLCVRLAGIHEAIDFKRQRLALRRLYGFVLSPSGDVTVAPSPRRRTVLGPIRFVARTNNHFWIGATFTQLRPPPSQRLAKNQTPSQNGNPAADIGPTRWDYE